MKTIVINKNKDKKIFKAFRKQLYKNDPYYVSTVEFTCDMLLYKQTKFAKSCYILPICIINDNINKNLSKNNILCEALIIKNPKDDFIQISFFESLPNHFDAVNKLLDFAIEEANKHNITKIIIGLNGHLSYGVGLTYEIKSPNTFDSTYTKPYYKEYFDKFIIDNKINILKHDLVAFSNNPNNVSNKLIDRKSNIYIRPINLKQFKSEMESFRLICNETIGKTFLYSQTDENHFEDLLESMKFFLKPENILFACNNDEIIGFAFWHPDYNEILKKGKNNSLLSIAFRYIFKKNKIKRVKLNSIGVKEKYQGLTTIKLLKEVSKYITNYEIIETNFVWCNNIKSMTINKHILKDIERTFVVYEVKL